VRFKLSEKSLFAYLLRSPWWVSFLVAIAYALAAHAIVDEKLLPIALIAVVPMLISGSMAIWRQSRTPSDSRIASTVETISAMNARQFRSLLGEAYQREGYEMSVMEGAADLKLVKNGRISLVSCKRWKAANQGIEALMELEALREACEAHAAIFVTTGNVTDNARQYAAQHKIQLLAGGELTRLLRLRK